MQLVEGLLSEFNKEQKIEFIRSVQSLFWSMSPVDVLREMDKEKLDNLFKFMFKNLPSEFVSKTVEMVRRMNEIAWIDVYGRKYTMDEISDEHLLNIVKFVSNGGGHPHFMTEEVIRNLFIEVDRRGFRHHPYRLDKALQYHCEGY